jgi:hypothetical protein
MLFGIILKHGLRVCYLGRHGTGQCCYLVIHTGNLLRPLQLFYFHLTYLLTLPHTTSSFFRLSFRPTGHIKLSENDSLGPTYTSYCHLRCRVILLK